MGKSIKICYSIVCLALLAQSCSLLAQANDGNVGILSRLDITELSGLRTSSQKYPINQRCAFYEEKLRHLLGTNAENKSQKEVYSMVIDSLRQRKLPYNNNQPVLDDLEGCLRTLHADIEKSAPKREVIAGPPVYPKSMDKMSPMHEAHKEFQEVRNNVKDFGQDIYDQSGVHNSIDHLKHDAKNMNHDLHNLGHSIKDNLGDRIVNGVENLDDRLDNLGHNIKNDLHHGGEKIRHGVENFDEHVNNLGHKIKGDLHHGAKSLGDDLHHAGHEIKDDLHHGIDKVRHGVENFDEHASHLGHKIKDDLHHGVESLGDDLHHTGHEIKDSFHHGADKVRHGVENFDDHMDHLGRDFKDGLNHKVDKFQHKVDKFQDGVDDFQYRLNHGRDHYDDDRHDTYGNRHYGHDGHGRRSGHYDTYYSDHKNHHPASSYPREYLEDHSHLGGHSGKDSAGHTGKHHTDADYRLDSSHPKERYNGGTDVRRERWLEDRLAESRNNEIRLQRQLDSLLKHGPHGHNSANLNGHHSPNHPDHGHLGDHSLLGSHDLHSEHTGHDQHGHENPSTHFREKLEQHHHKEGHHLGQPHLEQFHHKYDSGLGGKHLYPSGKYNLNTPKGLIKAAEELEDRLSKKESIFGRCHRYYLLFNYPEKVDEDVIKSIAKAKNIVPRSYEVRDTYYMLDIAKTLLGSDEKEVRNAGKDIQYCFSQQQIPHLHQHQHQNHQNHQNHIQHLQPHSIAGNHGFTNTWKNHNGMGVTATASVGAGGAAASASAGTVATSAGVASTFGGWPSHYAVHHHGPVFPRMHGIPRLPSLPKHNHS